MMHWHELYETRFGQRLSAQQQSSWSEDIRASLDNPSRGEVETAIKKLAERYADGKLKRKATASDVINEIRRYRRRRIGRESETGARCAYCRGSGWMSFCGWLDGKNRIVQFGNGTLRDTYEGSAGFTAGMGIQCLCSKGRMLAQQAGANNRRTAGEVKSWIDGIPDDPHDPDYMWRAAG